MCPLPLQKERKPATPGRSGSVKAAHVKQQGLLHKEERLPFKNGKKKITQRKETLPNDKSKKIDEKRQRPKEEKKKTGEANRGTWYLKG